MHCVHGVGLQKNIFQTISTCTSCVAFALLDRLLAFLLRTLQMVRIEFVGQLLFSFSSCPARVHVSAYYRMHATTARTIRAREWLVPQSISLIAGKP